jgi:hypothetical protein
MVYSVLSPNVTLKGPLISTASWLDGEVGVEGIGVGVVVAVGGRSVFVAKTVGVATLSVGIAVKTDTGDAVFAGALTDLAKTVVIKAAMMVAPPPMSAVMTLFCRPGSDFLGVLLCIFDYGRIKGLPAPCAVTNPTTYLILYNLSTFIYLFCNPASNSSLAPFQIM